MSDSNYNKRSRPITLTKLEDTDHYHLWCTTTKSTFDIHNVLKIVLRTEPKPKDANETVVADWDRRRKLAKEALLSALKPAQLLRVSHLKTARQIWKRLENEYGQISDLKRAQLDAELHSLRKANNKKMKDHIDEFESIRQKIEFHSSEPMLMKDINIAFLISLGDSDTWKNYRNSNLHRAVNMKTVDLIAEVTIIDDSSNSAVSSSSISPPFEGPERALPHRFPLLIEVDINVALIVVPIAAADVETAIVVEGLSERTSIQKNIVKDVKNGVTSLKIVPSNAIIARNVAISLTITSSSSG